MSTVPLAEVRHGQQDGRCQGAIAKASKLNGIFKAAKLQPAVGTTPAAGPSTMHVSIVRLTSFEVVMNS